MTQWIGTRESDDLLQNALEQAYQGQAIGDDMEEDANLGISILWDARKYLQGQFQTVREHELMGVHTRLHFRDTDEYS
jgi:hypothetical protein